MKLFLRQVRSLVKLSFLELRCVRNASELRFNRSSESVGDFDELQDFRDIFLKGKCRAVIIHRGEACAKSLRAFFKRISMIKMNTDRNRSHPCHRK